jgi:ABC-2 type transport system ATP-binding protein
MQKIIKVENLNYSIPYGKEILKDISFELFEGEFIGILGLNGSGKTTLMDLLLGYRPQTSGMIEVLDESPLSYSRKNLHSICFLAHDSIAKGNLTIEQLLDWYADLYPNYSRKEESFLMEIFKLNRHDKIGSLSTGQQRKAQAVAAFSACPKIVLIDEITAVLDPETRDQFFRVIHHLKTNNKMSFIIATNIAEDLIGRADKVLFIDQGRGKMTDSHEILNLFKIEKVS